MESIYIVIVHSFEVALRCVISNVLFENYIMAKSRQLNKPSQVDGHLIMLLLSSQT